MNKLIATALVCTACGGAGMGADTRADITKQMALAQQPLAGCYETALKSNRKLKGIVMVDVVAEAKTGKFTKVAIGRDEVADPTVQQCIIDEVSKLKLDKPQSTQVAFSYPFRFAPNK